MNKRFILKEYLQEIDPIDRLPVIINSHPDGTWIQTHGFKRGFCIHCVFTNIDTNDCAFHVIDADFDNNEIQVQVPNMGVYNNFENMIIGVELIYQNLEKF
jgi:hypothetical protein